MNKYLAKLVFIGLIAGIYVLVSKVTTNSDFETKSINLMKQQGAKTIGVLDRLPGCKGKYELSSASFDQSSFFSKTGEGRTLYIDSSKNIFDIKWNAEIVDDGKMIIVQAKDIASVQAQLTGLMLRGCNAT
ncbi:hypothetical protein QN382_23150 [Pseudomonas sp. 10B1]|uniref:hypothetical protein n=1 Tax=Pseudomonas sp. 10B1 TaxID=3048573 RepID=UPI002B22B3BF|nr:hypothetical protein [Pseudomonas sp. 10B1]MEB0312152.1 hypothetical protein [Pseudomonas sp. 10B1]